MKKRFLFQMSLMMLLAVYVMPSKALAETFTGDASARIVQALGIEADDTFKLNFGDIVPTSALVEVAIDPEGEVTAINVSVSGSDASQGKFNITGEANKSYDVSFALATITLSDGGSETMEVNNFVYSPPSDANHQLDGEGKAVVSVGATLVVGADQAVGQYAGTFDILVNY